MLYLILKAAISGIVIAAASELARRQPTIGALVVSLPLVSILAMLWLWQDRPDAANMADFVQSTLWFSLISMPMFLIIPALLRHGFGFWASLLVGIAATALLYGLFVWSAPRLGLRL